MKVGDTSIIDIIHHNQLVLSTLPCNSVMKPHIVLEPLVVQGNLPISTIHHLGRFRFVTNPLDYLESFCPSNVAYERYINEFSRISYTYISMNVYAYECYIYICIPVCECMYTCYIILSSLYDMYIFIYKSGHLILPSKKEKPTGIVRRWFC